MRPPRAARRGSLRGLARTRQAGSAAPCAQFPIRRFSSDFETEEAAGSRGALDRRHSRRCTAARASCSAIASSSSSSSSREEDAAAHAGGGGRRRRHAAYRQTPLTKCGRASSCCPRSLGRSGRYSGSQTGRRLGHLSPFQTQRPDRRRTLRNSSGGWRPSALPGLRREYLLREQ